ncbi:hypothetical protein [Actinomyces radicidentis]|uniref:hypothetical protein n=1 Tax=Actinomyces radicidentis TaxID=111015 RepID=UPI0026E0F8C2|nr:hypothetical protein [Actinomyces radicidentis]
MTTATAAASLTALAAPTVTDLAPARALPAVVAAQDELRSGPFTGPWAWTTIVALVVVLVVALGWILYARAVRVDRLHRQVLGARATLEAELTHRAQAAADLAASGALDPASALLLSRAAHDALEAEGPVVDDCLDPDERGGAHPARPRALIESDLTRVIRAVAHEGARAELAEGPVGADCLARLDRASYRLGLARRFHNIHVAEARRLRARPGVRLLHLAGSAPLPATFDIDDDATAPVTGKDDDA